MKVWTVFQPALKILSLRVDAPGLRVQIQARRGGIVAFLMHLLGLGNVQFFSASSNGFRRDGTSFAGEQKVYVAKEHVSSTLFVMSKPVEWLSLAVSLVFPGVGLMVMGKAMLPIGAGLLVTALVLVLIFFIAPRRVTIGIETDAGSHYSLRLKAKAPDLEKLRWAAKILERLSGAPESPDTSGGEPDSLDFSGADIAEKVAPSRPSRSTAAGTIECPHCRARMQISAAHRGQQVRCPACREAFQVG
jgi:predicted Zn finger-like uncharacterized protein